MRCERDGGGIMALLMIPSARPMRRRYWSEIVWRRKGGLTWLWRGRPRLLLHQRRRRLVDCLELLQPLLQVRLDCLEHRPLHQRLVVYLVRLLLHLHPRQPLVDCLVRVLLHLHRPLEAYLEIQHQLLPPVVYLEQQHLHRPPPLEDCLELQRLHLVDYLAVVRLHQLLVVDFLVRLHQLLLRVVCSGLHQHLHLRLGFLVVVHCQRRNPDLKIRAGVDANNAIGSTIFYSICALSGDLVSTFLAVDTQLYATCYLMRLACFDIN
mmetsp:Transcript_12738/g.19216  ORF Transcript_12738/g.19216 Transcript_12738/m.19216 type:complete len:265 (-) Transcript_12738:110-904(-)